MLSLIRINLDLCSYVYFLSSSDFSLWVSTFLELLGETRKQLVYNIQFSRCLSFCLHSFCLHVSIEFLMQLSYLKPKRTRYESVNYGISNYCSTKSEKAYRDLQNPKFGVSEAGFD